MSRTSRTSTGRALAVALLLAPGAAAEWKEIPREGLVLTAGKVLRSMGRGNRVNISKSLNYRMNPFPNIDHLRRSFRNEGELLELEGIRYRMWERLREKVQMQSLGDGVITHVGYKKARDSAKRQKARERRGGKKKSLLERVFDF